MATLNPRSCVIFEVWVLLVRQKAIHETKREVNLQQWTEKVKKKYTSGQAVKTLKETSIKGSSWSVLHLKFLLEILKKVSKRISPNWILFVLCYLGSKSTWGFFEAWKLKELKDCLHLMDRLLLKRQVYLRSSTTNIERELHKDLRDFVFVDFTLLPVPEIKHHKHCERKLHKDLRDLVLVDFTLLPVLEITHNKHCERKLHKDLRDFVLVDFTLLPVLEIKRNKHYERKLHKDLRDFVLVNFTLLPVLEIKRNKHCERKLHKDLRDLVLVDFTLLPVLEIKRNKHWKETIHKDLEDFIPVNFVLLPEWSKGKECWGNWAYRIRRMVYTQVLGPDYGELCEKYSKKFKPKMFFLLKIEKKHDALLMHFWCTFDALLKVHQKCIKFDALSMKVHQKCIRFWKCIKSASKVHQKCIKSASWIHQIFIKIYHKNQKCIKSASKVHQKCIKHVSLFYKILKYSQVLSDILSRILK